MAIAAVAPGLVRVVDSGTISPIGPVSVGVTDTVVVSEKVATAVDVLKGVYRFRGVELVTLGVLVALSCFNAARSDGNGGTRELSILQRTKPAPV
jgi:hypothetical protein